jgi:hypothetical protein
MGKVFVNKLSIINLQTYNWLIGINIMDISALRAFIPAGAPRTQRAELLYGEI